MYTVCYPWWYNRQPRKHYLPCIVLCSSPLCLIHAPHPFGAENGFSGSDSVASTGPYLPRGRILDTCASCCCEIIENINTILRFLKNIQHWQGYSIIMKLLNKMLHLEFWCLHELFLVELCHPFTQSPRGCFGDKKVLLAWRFVSITIYNQYQVWGILR